MDRTLRVTISMRMRDNRDHHDAHRMICTAAALIYS